MVINTVSLSAVSEIAMVPESECSTPTLIVSAAKEACEARPKEARAAESTVALMKLRRVVMKGSLIGCRGLGYNEAL